MAVTPFHVPFKTEYKPLGLENLMQPLSDIQTKFDATKLALEDATYNISRLSQDDPRGKELVKELKDKTDYIAEELGRTGNYRQAAIQLKKLNKSFTEDLETKAIVGNYDAYKKAYDEQQKRLEKGEITQTDFDTWDYKIKNTFSGTKYDPSTQKYTSINTRPPEENREKELQDLALRITGMLANQQTDEISNLGNTNGFDAALLNRTVQYRSLEQTKEEVANFLKGQPRFQDYILDKADREYFYNNHKTETAAANGADISPDYFKDQIYQGSVKKIQNQIDWVKKNSKDPETLKKLQKNLTDLQTDYQDALNNNTYEQFTKELYKKDALGQFDRLAYTSADLVDYRSSSLDLDIKTTDESGKTKANQDMKDMAEIGTIPTTISSGLSSTLPLTKVNSYTGTADPLNNAKVQLEKDFNMAAGRKSSSTNSSFANSLLELIGGKKTNKNIFDLNTLNENYSGTQVKILRANDKLNEVYTGYLESINTAPNKIADINNKIAKTNDAAVKKELITQKEQIGKELINNKLALSASKQMLNEIIKDAGAKLFNAYGIDPKISSTTKNENVTANIKIANSTSNDLSGIEITDNTRKILKTILEKNGYNPNTLESSAQSDPYKLLFDLGLNSSAQLKEVVRRIDPTGKKNQFELSANDINNFRDKTNDPYTIFLGQVLREYEINLRIDNPSVVNPLEVTISDPLNKFSSGVSDEFKKEIIKNTTGASAMPRAIITNSSTLANTTGDINYDISAYETDRPHLVGKDPNGQWIVRFNIKGEFAGNKATVSNAVANHLKTGVGVNKEEPTEGTSFVSGDQIEKWKKENPDNLYLIAGASNLDIVKNCSDKYANIVTSGIKLGTEEGQEAIRQATENFAPIWLVADSKRRELYMGAASTINDGIKNKEYKSFIEPPAIWNDLGNNTSEGFSINYQVINGSLTATIYKHVKDSDGNIKSTNFVKTENINDVNSNLPTALLMLNMTYGTGRIQDIPKVKSGFNDVDFASAFYFNDQGTVTNGVNKIIPVGTTIR
jgi:hypothetical protein